MCPKYYYLLQETQLHISLEEINTQPTKPDTTVQPYCLKKTNKPV